MVLRLLLACSLALVTPAAWAADDADHGGDDNAAHAESHVDGADAEHSAADERPDPLAFDPDLAVFTLIVFGLLVALLRFTAWGPIVAALSAREQGIADDLAAAESKHDEAKALLDRHEAKLAAAADDVREMLEEARRDAESTKATILSQAQAAADAERQRAIRDVEQARDSAIKQLAEQSANLSIDLAAKVVKQEITPERQGEIVHEALQRMASADPSNN